MKVYYSKCRNANLAINRKYFSKLVCKAIEFAGIHTYESSAIIINFVSKKQISQINSEYMKHEGVTDVISFSYMTEDCIESEENIIAELFICVSKAEIEARQRKIDFAQELILYVVHGILHIAGYDDLDENSRRKMRKAEANCMKELTKISSLNSIIKQRG